MSGDKAATGRIGEELARQFLEKKGFEIVETNYRYGHGEIDIIARDGEVLVFCEVKARRTDTYGPPEYAITPRKQSQLRRIATAYLAERDIHDRECRFDVIAIRLSLHPPGIEHFVNAFT
jgi:putative endonuclease